MALGDAFQPDAGSIAQPAPAQPSQPDDNTDNGGGGAAPAPAAAPSAPATPAATPTGPTPALTSAAQDYVDRMADAGYSAPQIAGGLGVHSYESGGNFSPTAINPTSGAAGIAQDLGPRKAGLIKYLQDNGLQPTVANETDYNISELRGPEADADRQIRAAQTVEDATYAWSHGFERPGAEGEAKEIPYAIALGNRALPLVQARLAERAQQNANPPAGDQLAENGGAVSDASNAPLASATRAATLGNSGVAAPDPALQLMWQHYQQRIGPVGGGKFDNDPVPAAGVGASGNPIQDMWGRYQQRMSDQARAADASPQNRAQQVAAQTGESWGTFGHAMSIVPNMLLRGFVADTLGLPGDVAHGVTQFFNQHPMLSRMIGQGDPADAVVANAENNALGPRFGLPQDTAGPGLVSKTPGSSGPSTPIPPSTPVANLDPQAVVDPNAKGAHPLPTSEDARKAIEYATGLDLRNPAEKGDLSLADNLIGNAAEFVGMAANPIDLVTGGTELAAMRELPSLGTAAKTAIRLLNEHVILPASISTGPDLAAAVTGAVGGTPQEQAGVKLAMTGAIGAAAGRAALMEKGENALVSGASALGQGFGGGAPSVLDQAFQDAFGPDRWQAEKTAALDNLNQAQANRELVSGLPPAGAVEPHPTLARAFAGNDDALHIYNALPEADQQRLNEMRPPRREARRYSTGFQPEGGPA